MLKWNIFITERSLTSVQKKPVKIVFGFTSNTEQESHGLMMYYKNRLIKAFEKVGVQKQVV